MENKLRFIRYSRKSSEKKERQIASIEDQNAECEQFALKNSLNVVYRLQESKSAYKPNKREVFNEMIQLIETKKADAILSWHPNRLSRNPEEGGKLLQMLQDGVIKEIRATSGEVYTQESDQLILQINFGVANQYSRDISRNVKRGLKHKVERGEYPGNAFIGYRMVGEKGQKNLVIHEIEAPLIKETYKLASTGKYSLVNLSMFLYSKGLHAKNGNRFCKQQMHRILTNPSYYGYFKFKGTLYKGNYEPIISKPLFDAVQNALRDRSKPSINTWAKYTYNGIFKCPRCDSSISTTIKDKYYKKTNRKARYIYLHCTKRKGYCDQPPITLDKFEEKLLSEIMRISIDEEVWTLGIKLLKEKNKEELGRSNLQLDKYHDEYKRLQVKLNTLIDMRANKELTKEEFMIQKELSLREQARVEGLIADIKYNASNWLELAEDFLNNAFYAQDVMKSDKILEKKDLLLDIGENFFLEDKNLQFSFKKPYDVLLKPEYRNVGRAQYIKCRTTSKGAN